jgi:hypothetical protein
VAICCSVSRCDYRIARDYAVHKTCFSPVPFASAAIPSRAVKWNVLR